MKNWARLEPNILCHPDLSSLLRCWLMPNWPTHVERRPRPSPALPIWRWKGEYWWGSSRAFLHLQREAMAFVKSLTTRLYTVLHGIPNKSQPRARSKVREEDSRAFLSKCTTDPSKTGDGVRWDSTSNRGSGISLPKSQVWSKTCGQLPSLQLPNMTHTVMCKTPGGGREWSNEIK